MTNLLTWFGKYMLLGIAAEGISILLVLLGSMALCVLTTGTKYIKTVLGGELRGMAQVLSERRTAVVFLIDFLVWPIDLLAHGYTNLKSLKTLWEALNQAKES